MTDEERKEAIRQVEEEIAAIKDYVGSHGLAAGSIYDRILAREQAALAELKRGMK